MMQTIRRWLAALAVVTLAACGGGSDDSGSPIFGDGSGGTATEASDLVLVLSAFTIANDGTETVQATVTALDAGRRALPGVPVSISVDSGGIATVPSSTTGESGTVEATIGIGADRSNRTMTVTAVSGKLTRTASLQVVDAGVGGGSASIAVTLSSATVTAASPAQVTVALRDASGNPITGRVVTLTTVRGNLATLSVDSVLTNASGEATATLRANENGSNGADELIARANLGSAIVQGAASFNVVGGAPSLQLTASSTTLRLSAGPATLTAVVRDTAGRPVANRVVSFESGSGLVKLSAPSRTTNDSGVAAVTVVPADPTIGAAETVTATADVDGRAVAATVSLQIVAEAPSMTLTPTGTNTVATGAPATYRVVVRDLTGNAVPNAVVRFDSAFGLVVFNPATAATNTAGEATTIVSPASATSNGADTLQASATVAGIVVASQAVVQVVGATSPGAPSIDLALSSSTISSASPATVTATLKDPSGQAIGGQVVTFTVVRELGKTNVATALTNGDGQAVAILSPASSTSVGADEITASALVGGTALQATRGFTVQATNITLDAFTAETSPLSAYGQTALKLRIGGASVGSPVAISVSSACVSLGKALLSPSTFTATTSTVELQYRDLGCGAVQEADQLQAVVDGTATTRSLTLAINSPAASSIGFVQASPEVIYLRGSGFVESSVVTFEVRDAAGNPLPGRDVELRLQTGAGGVTMDGRPVEALDSPNPLTQRSNAQGRVAVRVNSGTLPTPVRVNAKLLGTTISTVSSNLSVAVGLPSQINFSLSQGTKNIEGYNIDGTPNTYQIIAADRSGNPVPPGTSINFVTEGGQVEAIRQTQIVNGIARTTANFVSAEPRPVDGRVTITAYALGEESFIDLNGNNAYDSGEPFQDLGNIFKDRNFDGAYDRAVDEFVPLNINNDRDCTVPGSPLLALNASIPSMPGTCSANWSGAGQVYVRRAVETVLSTSRARPLWNSVTGLDDSCIADSIVLQNGPRSNQTKRYALVNGSKWYSAKDSSSGVLSLYVADANPVRFNPMAAGTTVTASTPTQGLTVTVAGGTVPSSTDATTVSIAYGFDPTAGDSGTIFVTFTSPSGTATTAAVEVVRNETKPSNCPL